MSARSRTHRRVHGHALLEYSFLAWMLAAGLLLGMSVPFHQGRHLLQLFLAAYQAYFDSFSFVLGLPFP